MARVWRMWGMKAQILRSFSAQEHDTYTIITANALLWYLSFTKYISVYLYTISLGAVCSVLSLMFWAWHLINQNNATALCIIRKYLLYCKTFQLAPAKRAHWSTYQLMSQCCTIMSRYPPHWSCTDITFLCPSAWMNLGL